MKKRIVVLISGNGSNLQSILDSCIKGKINGGVNAVFSNNANAFGLERAQKAGVPTHALSTAKFSDRSAFDQHLKLEIDTYKPDLILLAGYMLILSREFVQHYEGRILNIHPSLLPKYPGLHTHSQVLKNNDKIHGASVHFVTEELDQGPVILQAKIPIFDNDSEENIISRVKDQEHIIYPLVVSWFIDSRLKIKDGVVLLDS